MRLVGAGGLRWQLGSIANRNGRSSGAAASARN